MNYNPNENRYNATLSHRSDAMNYGGHSGNPTKTNTATYSATTNAIRNIIASNRSERWGYNR